MTAKTHFDTTGHESTCTLFGAAALARAPSAEGRSGARTALGAEQMMKRIAYSREIGCAANYLASDEAAFVTSASLIVDGGRTAQ